jgi:hypothetical protein
MNPRKLLLALGLLSSAALADPGMAIIPLAARFGASLESVTDAAIRAEQIQQFAHLTLTNTTGQVWGGLDIVIEVYDYRNKRWVDSSLDDSIAPGLALDTVSPFLPYAAWREQMEVRINGIYTGRPGGNWTLVFATDPERMALRFVEPRIQPGDSFAMRYPIADKTAMQYWRLRIVATPEAR